MVISLRHGSIKLDYKPCRQNLKCTNALRTSETSQASHWLRQPQEVISLSETSLNIVTLDTTITCPQITSLPPRSQTFNAANLSTAASSLYDEPSVASLTTSASVASATIYSSKKDDAIASKLVSHWRDLDTLDSLPYLEQPLSYRTSSTSSHSLSTSYPSFSSLLPDSSPISRVIVDNKSWRVFVLYVILSMFLLCKGCFCIKCEHVATSSRDNTSWSLSSFSSNKSKVGAIMPGQCLNATGSYWTSICKKKTPSSERMESLRHTNMKFCDLPLDSILSNSEKAIVTNCGAEKGCKSVIQRIEDIEVKLNDLYCSFVDILERMDCMDSYSRVGNCNKCRAAYKRWLCSIYVDYYIEGEIIKPCLDFCDQVSESCPFFRPQGETQGESLIGEPGFLCKDSIIQHEAADSIYGKEGCCVKPCQMYHILPHPGDPYICPNVNQTSTCSNSTNAAAVLLSSTTSSHVLHLLVCLTVSRIVVLQMIYNQFDYIGYT